MLLAAVALCLSYNRSKDNACKNNRCTLIPQKEELDKSGNDENKSCKPLANLVNADDGSVLVQVPKDGLLRNRFLVDAFTNPEEALQSFKSSAGSYSQVLSDVRMPAMSGIQLPRKVKEINSNVEVALMTSFEITDNEFSKAFSSMYIDGFVRESIGIRDLINKILSIVGEIMRRKEGQSK